MTPSKTEHELEELWSELLMDALASDGPISDQDVKNAVKRWRPRIEAALLAERKRLRRMVAEWTPVMEELVGVAMAALLQDAVDRDATHDVIGEAKRLLAEQEATDEQR